MTHRDPSIWLSREEARCEPAAMRFGCAATTCARYLAPIDGAPLGDLFQASPAGVCGNHETVRRRPAAEPAPRKVHKPLGSE